MFVKRFLRETYDRVYDISVVRGKRRRVWRNKKSKREEKSQISTNEYTSLVGAAPAKSVGQ